MTLTEKIQIEIDKGYVRCQRHRTLPLTIYNYTEQCSFDKAYNDVNSMCRGLCIDDAGHPANNPLGKFYNFEETHPEFAPEDVESITIKEDGSCIFIFWFRDQWVCCTRGSFISTQALYAQALFTTYDLDQRTKELQVPTFLNSSEIYKEWTWIFELVGPGNINVTRAYPQDELRLLAARHNLTGRESSSENLDRFGLPRPATLVNDDFNKIYNWVKTNEDPNFEGVVYRLKDGTRFKIKSELYCRLHRAMTGEWTKAKALEWWLAQRAGTFVPDPEIPDEWYAEVQVKIDEVEKTWLLYWKYTYSLRDELVRFAYAKEQDGFSPHDVRRLCAMNFKAGLPYLNSLFTHRHDIEAWQAQALQLFCKDYLK